MLQLTESRAFRVVVLILAWGGAAFAAELCATIMDYGRLPLPSATMNVTNLETGKSYATLSDKNGNACVSRVPEGLYSVDASLPGFLHVKYYPVRVDPVAKEMLTFMLPFGEIAEGPWVNESTLSGTLLKGGVPLQAAQICMVGLSGAPKTCTATNDLGEYALMGPAEVYNTEIRTRDGEVYKSKVDLSSPGIYRNRLSVDATSKRQ
jgi:Carboxypeptidase regulatory-like domain